MGNRKFKFSEMIPNAWFYKLRDIGTGKHHQQHARKKEPNLPPPPPPPPQQQQQQQQHQQHQQQQHHPLCHTRKSYYFTRDLNPKSAPDLLLFDPPRKSTKKTRPTPKKRPTFTPTPTSTTKSSTSSSSSVDQEPDHSVSTPHLPPIKTDRTKSIHTPIKQKKTSVQKQPSPVFTKQVRRYPAGSPRFRIRVNSPRVARRPQVNSSKGNLSRKSVSSDSLAVVKSTCDPRRDFRDSMVEMILENNIRAAKDLEELLACYLSLNTDEYHDVIIQVFKQIWFDLNKIAG